MTHEVKGHGLFLEMKTSEVQEPTPLNFTEACGNKQAVNVSPACSHVLSPRQFRSTERFHQMATTPASSSDGPGFKSRP